MAAPALAAKGPVCPVGSAVGGRLPGLAGAYARLNLLSLLVTWHIDWLHLPASWAGWGTVEFFGLGLIIFARIMRVSAGMHADLEGTV